MWKEEKTPELIRLLNEAYPNADCALNFGNIFQLLIAVVLSAQTTDKQVNVVTPALFESFPDAQALSKADVIEVEEHIRRIGMYKTKAKNIVALSKNLCEKYGGEVPSDFDELTALPGVGRKTANVVQAVGFGIPAIPVDTHVFRVAGRIGVAKGKDVLETEMLLQERLPRNSWIDMHHAIILHGRNVCSARKPKCEECTISQLCDSAYKENK